MLFDLDEKELRMVIRARNYDKRRVNRKITRGVPLAVFVVIMAVLSDVLPSPASWCIFALLVIGLFAVYIKMMQWLRSVDKESEQQAKDMFAKQ
jgi:hypothetical protein